MKGKAAELSAKSLGDASTQEGKQISPDEMAFLLNGIGGGVGGMGPRGAHAPTGPTFHGPAIQMPGLSPMSGQGIGPERVASLMQGNIGSALAPKTASMLSGIGNYLGIGAAAPAAGGALGAAAAPAAATTAAEGAAAAEAASSSGILSSLLAFL